MATEGEGGGLMLFLAIAGPVIDTLGWIVTRRSNDLDPLYSTVGPLRGFLS